jgi:hypothetical protein
MASGDVFEDLQTKRVKRICSFDGVKYSASNVLHLKDKKPQIYVGFLATSSAGNNPHFQQS